jgi:hypothetical protein
MTTKSAFSALGAPMSSAWGCRGITAMIRPCQCSSKEPISASKSGYRGTECAGSGLKPAMEAMTKLCSQRLDFALRAKRPSVKRSYRSTKWRSATHAQGKVDPNFA